MAFVVFFKKIKTVIFLFACFVLFSIHLNAQNDTSSDSTAKSVVYIYRLPRYAGAGTAMKVYFNNYPIVSLRNGSVFKYVTMSGEYTFSLEMGSKTGVKFNLEPGKTYYLECAYNVGFWVASPEMTRLDSLTATSRMQQYSLKEQHYKPLSNVRPKNRIGLFLGAGGGFETIPMFIDTDGKEVTLSTGGGFAIGAEYGYESSRVFDFSAKCFYQGSSLSEPLKNADATFERFGVTITPSLIIPIKSGERYRFRLGGGLGMYSNGTMKIDASKITGGGKFTFKYTPAFGYHGSLLFESNFSEKFSFILELKYYSVQYEYTSIGSTATSPDPDINLPDGSGLDFLMGYYFHF